MLLAVPRPDLPPVAGGSFADHLDPTALHWLPAGLELERDDGTPGLSLVLYRPGDGSAARAGGLLAVRLARRAPTAGEQDAATAAGYHLVPALLDRARYRLTRPALPPSPGQPVPAGSAADEPLSGWRPTSCDGPLVIDDLSSLDAPTAVLLDRALDTVADPVVVEVRASVTGVVPGLPVLVRCAGAALHRALRDGLGADPVPDEGLDDAVAAILASLPATVLDVVALGGPLPDRSAVTAQLAPRLVAGPLFVPGDGGTHRVAGPEVVGPGAPAERLAVSLADWRTVTLPWSARWSVTDALAALDPQERDRVVTRVDRTDPFQPLALDVVDDLPVDPGSVRSLSVELRHPGPAGVTTSHVVVFDGTARTRAVTVVGPPGQPDVPIRATATLTLQPAPGAVPAWPRRLPPVTLAVEPPVVLVDAARLGVTGVHVDAGDDVFTAVAALDVTLLAAALPVAGRRLDPAHRAGTLVAPAGPDPLRLVVRALDRDVPPDGGEMHAVVVRDVALTAAAGHTAVTIGLADVSVLAPETVAVSRTDDARVVVAAVAELVDPAGHLRTLTLTPGATVTVPLWRARIFDGPDYRYRLSYVAIGPDGSTRPLVTTPWAVHAGDLAVSFPLED